MKLQKLISTNFIFSNSKVLLYKKDQTLLVKGPLGVVFLTLPVGFEVNWVDSCSVYLNSVLKSTILLQKTYSQLLVQKIRGVTVGFFEILIIHGVG